MGASSMDFSLDDASFPPYPDLAGLVVNRHNVLFAKYRHTALGGQGVSIADTWGGPGQHTLSGGVVVAYEPFQEILQEYRPRIGDETRQAYRHRIEKLRAEARLDAITWNVESEADFLAFINATPRWRKGLLGLVNNGNLRVTWKGDDGDHLAVQFLGERFIECVIFKRRPGSRRVSRVAGVDTLNALHRLVAAFDLARLVH